MIEVYYLFTENLSESDFDFLPSVLSEYVQLKLKTYRNPEDKCLLLASQVLLSKILAAKGYDKYTLNRLTHKSTGRPFFDGASFDFNISHTDGCVALVFSESCRVGIDIESIKAIDFSDFTQLFSPVEWENICSAKNRFEQFYLYWTQLESAVKADGRGLSLLCDATINLHSNYVIIDEQKWYSKHKVLAPSISCCVASNLRSEIRFTQMS